MRVQQNIYNFCKKSKENETKRKLFFMLGIPCLCEIKIYGQILIYCLVCGHYNSKDQSILNSL